ncbi:hypothetical protein APA_1312 [Pseudanabaena sp. lw0831]|uniref:hypothetical protein n=1 Tax=Pseudanabaena sp. lw0831 TaxID=1357935 RepID=UPI001915127A|nr:hypothetical protein [Pseudanabaena sp. lw0831]GBO53405.1 hypothetical protein APA_1312 [Pseudanabaena sp. lw0831]
MNRIVLKPIQFLFLIALICCLQSAAWATIGIAEWSTSTPGGNKIGNNDTLPPSAKGTAIYNNRKVFVDRVGKIGFYDGAIIGETDNKFFLFDESTKALTKYSTKSELCADIKTKGLNFNNNLSFFNGSYPYDYYIIHYALYFLIPFVILLVGHAIAKRQIPFTIRIDRILEGVAFPLQLYVFSTAMNFAFITSRTNESVGFDFFASGVLVGTFGSLLWVLSRFSLTMLDKISNVRQASSSIFFALFKCIFVAGIITSGLLFLLSPWQSKWTSIQYFSCLELL